MAERVEEYGESYNGAGQPNRKYSADHHPANIGRIAGSRCPAGTMKKACILPRTSIQQRISQLEERKRALMARLGKQERRDDTRRKILIGALVLHRLEHAVDAEFTRRLAGSPWLDTQSSLGLANFAFSCPSKNRFQQRPAGIS